jgi:hypothetical protein
MILFLLFLLFVEVCSYELILKSSRLRVRPDENAYAFGILNNENIDYFNCTIGKLEIHKHEYNINWVWKYKINYETENFTTIINISKNNILYTKKLFINILEYTPRIIVERNIIKAEDSIIVNKGKFIGNNITVNLGTISYSKGIYQNEWNWTGNSDYLFTNEDYVVIKIWIDQIVSNEFFVYKSGIVFSKISYSLYIPNYVIEKEFIDIKIINIATSHVFKIDQSRIVSKEFYEKSNNENILYYIVFKINIEFISINTALNIKDNINNYLNNGLYFEKIINSNISYGKNMFLLEKPIIDNTYISSKNIFKLYIIISLMIFILLTQVQIIYMCYLIKSFTII